MTSCMKGRFFMEATSAMVSNGMNWGLGFLLLISLSLHKCKHNTVFLRLHTISYLPEKIIHNVVIANTILRRSIFDTFLVLRVVPTTIALDRTISRHIGLHRWHLLPPDHRLRFSSLNSPFSRWPYGTISPRRQRCLFFSLEDARLIRT